MVESGLSPILGVTGGEERQGLQFGIDPKAR
jgi:hypothetical protein